MKVLVCGSRDWDDPQAIRGRLVWLPNNASIIHGAARGADQMAATAARSIGIPEQEFPADWRGKGKRAGILRNLAMLDQEPDLVLAFQRNGSVSLPELVRRFVREFDHGHWPELVA